MQDELVKKERTGKKRKGLMFLLQGLLALQQVI